MEEKKKLNKKSLYAILAVITLGVIGVTFAYYQTNNTLTNEFNAGKYKIKTEEVFVSPDNWQPGDVTEKKVNVTNEGTIDAAVKVCFRQKWEDENGNQLPLLSNNITLVNLAFSNISLLTWLEDCDNNYEDKYCSYYYKRLEPNEVTEDLLRGVEFYKYADVDTTTTCTEDPTTHTKSCTSEVNGYAGGKYTLYVDIETVQYNSYQDAWGNVSIIKGYDESYQPICENLNIRRSLTNNIGHVSYLINSTMYLKDSELSDYDLTYADCDTVYVNSVSESNRYNRCKDLVYNDSVIHSSGDTVSLKTFNRRELNFNDRIYNEEDNYTLYTNGSITIEPIDTVQYSKSLMVSNYLEYSNSDRDTMNFSSIKQDKWENEGYVDLNYTSTFKMPNHGVLFGIEESDFR